MKLYATTTTERASKGQGGNDFLTVEIKAEKFNGIPTRANLYRLSLRNDNGELYADLLNYSTGEIIILTNKKSEDCGCEKNVFVCLEHSRQGECKHLFSTSVYNDKKLQGYKCNNCNVLVLVNPQFQTKGKK